MNPLFVTMPEKPVKPEPKRDEVELETQIIMRMPVVSKQAHFNSLIVYFQNYGILLQYSIIKDKETCKT